MIPQPDFTWSKFTMETLEQKVNGKDTRTTPVTSFWCLTVNFEHILHLVIVILYC